MSVAASAPAEWKTVLVSPKEIVVDRALNPRLAVDKETVEHYMEVFDQLPPVEAFDTERGRLLVDGWHRLAAAKALGTERIQARVRAGSYLEAKEYAALANLRHGKPLTREERGNVVESLICLHPERTDQWVAADAGCNQSTVSRRRATLEADGVVMQCISRQRPDGTWTSEGAHRPRKPDPWAGSLIAGDAFRRLAEIENASIDLICTDPPYGILFREDQEWDEFPEPPPTYDDPADEWEEMPLEDRLMAFTRCWLEAALPKLKPTGRLFVCFSQVHVHRLRSLLDDLAEREFDLVYSNTLIWHYKNVLAQPNDRTELKLSHEPILHYRARHAAALDFSVYGEEQGDVWTIATPQSQFTEAKHGKHPAQKPVELMRRIIALACPRDGIVLDPFAGSGTTGVAAFGLGRAFRLIERKPEYVAIARKRLDEARGAAEAAAGLPDAAGD